MYEGHLNYPVKLCHNTVNVNGVIKASPDLVPSLHKISSLKMNKEVPVQQMSCLAGIGYNICFYTLFQTPNYKWLIRLPRKDTCDAFEVQ